MIYYWFTITACSLIAFHSPKTPSYIQNTEKVNRCYQFILPWLSFIVHIFKLVTYSVPGEFPWRAAARSKLHNQLQEFIQAYLVIKSCKINDEYAYFVNLKLNKICAFSEGIQRCEAPGTWYWFHFLFGLLLEVCCVCVLEKIGRGFHLLGFNTSMQDLGAWLISCNLWGFHQILELIEGWLLLLFYRRLNSYY